MVDLSIIIVNYNVKEYLKNLLNSIKKSSPNILKEIIVIDNASDDGSVDLIKEKFPDIILIENKTNLGFGKANNQGLKIAKGKFLLIINPDTLVAEDTFAKMIDFFNENPLAAMAGCKILNPDGTLQLACRRSFPRPWIAFTKVTGLSSLFPKSKIFAQYNLTYKDENQTYEVDAISGSFMMLRKEVYDTVGGFDEQFFMYGEDLDFCYRIQNAGFKIFYVHTTQIIHYKGESTKRSSLDETKIFYQAMHIFVKKHFSTSLIVTLILRFAIASRTLLAFIGKSKIIIIGIILDFLTFNFNLYCAEQIYISIKPQWKGFNPEALIVIYTVPAIIHIFVSAFLGCYKKNNLSVFSSILALFLSFPILTSLTFFFKQFAFSRAVVIILYLLSFITMSFWRIIGKITFKKLFRAEFLKQKRTLIVGTDSSTQQLVSKIKNKSTELRNIIGIIGNSYKQLGEKIHSLEVIGTQLNIKKIIDDFKINEIIFSSTALSYNNIMQIVASLRNENIDFLVVGDEQDFIIGKTSISTLEDIPLFEIKFNISNLKMQIIKRTFDILIALFTLIFIYPFIFFKCKIFKKKSELDFFILNTPLVLLGKISFVGPRTNQIGNAVFLGKPGLTGYWYIEQGDIEYSKKLDFYYAKNQNIWLDIEILTKTITKMYKKV